MRSVDNSRGSGDKSRRVPVTNVGFLEHLLVGRLSGGAKVKARMKIHIYGYVITRHLLL